MNIPLLLAAALLAAAPCVRAEEGSEEEEKPEARVEEPSAPHVEPSHPARSSPVPSPAAGWSGLSADRVRVPKAAPAPAPARPKAANDPLYLPPNPTSAQVWAYCERSYSLTPAQLKKFDASKCGLFDQHNRMLSEMTPADRETYLKRAQGAAAANVASQQKDAAIRLKADTEKIDKKRAAADPPPPAPSNEKIALGEINGKEEFCFSQNGVNQAPLTAPDPRYAIQEVREKPGRYGARRCVIRGSAGIVVMVPDDYSTDWRDYKKHRYVLDRAGSTWEVNHLPAGFARPGTPGLRYWTDSRNYLPSNEMENMALHEVGLQSYWYATAPNGYRAAAYTDSSSRFLAWGRAGYPHTDMDGCALDVRGDPIKDMRTGVYACTKR